MIPNHALKLGLVAMDRQLIEAERELRAFGLIHWANKLAAISDTAGPVSAKAVAVMKLFGGFGTLNDIAFSDEDAPMGMTGQEATMAYLRVINALHNAAQQSLQAEGPASGGSSA